MVTAAQIKASIQEFWALNPNIVFKSNADSYLYDPPYSLGERGSREFTSGFVWTPTSVDPTQVRGTTYGIVLGDVTPLNVSNRWLVPLFFGILEDTGSVKLSPVLLIPLIFRDTGEGKLRQYKGPPPTLIQNNTESIHNPFPEDLFFAGDLVNAALLINFFAFGLAELLGAGPSDRTAAELSLAPLSGLIINQARAGVQRAFAIDAGKPGPIPTRSTWTAYDTSIQNWAPANHWPQNVADRKGNAALFDNNQIRIWRPSIVLTNEHWSLHTKIDLVKSGADDHVIVVAIGERNKGAQRGKLVLQSIATTVRFQAYPSKTFTVKQKDAVHEVRETWADDLLANASSLSTEDLRKIMLIERMISNTPGANGTFTDLLHHVAAAEPA